MDKKDRSDRVRNCANCWLLTKTKDKGNVCGYIFIKSGDRVSKALTDKCEHWKPADPSRGPL